MKNYAIAVLSAGLVLGVNVTPVQAYHCPLLAKECQALVAKMEKRGNADKAKVAKAKQGCDEALRLHEAGKHKDSVIKAGQAISLAGEAAK
ncbi:MAG: hypothetical protein ACE5LB_11695 [Acidiferrobacterales bacterium]